MDNIFKNLSIIACALSIAYVAVELKDPQCLWAFIPVVWLAKAIWNKDE